MKDLTQAFENACIFKAGWSMTVLNDLVKNFERGNPKNSIAWDFNSGEEVCGFLSNSLLVAYVHTKFPIGFATVEFESYKQRFAKKISIVIVENFDKIEWSVDLDRLAQVAPEISWNACIDAVNPKSFSIDDFRYATH